MTRIRTISHIVLVALSMQVVPALTARPAAAGAHQDAHKPARTAGFWHTISGWFNQQVAQAEKTADAMGDRLEQAAQKVEDRVQDAAQKAKKKIEKNAREAGSMADRIVEPVVKRVHQHVKRRMKPMIKQVEKHAKPAIERVVKSTLQEVEKQAQPAIERAEKRIQQNIGRTVSEYCMAGLGGIVAFIAVRKAATAMTSNQPGKFGSWMQEQDKNSSLVADVMIGGMIGMGIYGLTQSHQVENVPVGN